MSDPFKDLNRIIVNRLDIRLLLPWLIFGILAAACIGIWLSETTQNSKTPTSNNLDCIYGTWSTWTGCENNNCYAIGVRTRNIVQQAHGGVECNTLSLVQTESCAAILNCANPDCQYSPWSTWSECPKTCFHSGENCSSLPSQVRFRNVTRGPLPGGSPCDWTSLIESQQCAPTQTCAPNQNCVAAAPNPVQDCALCPEVGCTQSGIPYHIFCTRSVLQTASGTGAACTDLIYSITCPLPDCTASCVAQNLDAFRTCSNVCGPGFQIASDTVCPNLTTTNCNNGDCPTGALDISPYGTCTNYTAGVSCTVPEVSECMARCVMNDTCTAFYSRSDGFYYGDSISMNCIPGGSDIVYEWVPSSTNCITPTWDMVNAVCLYLCADDYPSFSVNRGFSFPFMTNTGAIQSCPITADMLSYSQMCPIQGVAAPEVPLSYMFAEGNTSFTRSFTNADNGQTWTLECQASADCVYQSWSDAQPWSICTEDCVLGQGKRTQTRAIVTPNYFLGNPCNLAEQVQVVDCNRKYELTSASLMVCSNTFETTFANVSEFLCQDICQSWSTNISPNLCNSIQFVYSSNTTHNDEVFLMQWTASITTVDDAVFAYDALQALYPSANLRAANITDLNAAYNSGFQVCLPGWYSNASSMRLRSSNAPLLESYPATFFDCPSTAVERYMPVTLKSQSDTTCYYGSRWTSMETDRPGVACSASYALVGSVCSRTTEVECPAGYAWDGSACAKLNRLGLSSELYMVGEIMQQAAIPNCTAPGVDFDAPNSGTPYLFMVGQKRDVPIESTSAFFIGYSNSAYDVNYTFATQQFQDELTCSLFPQRTDGLLNFKDCIPLGQAQTTTEPLAYNSNLYDVPCNEAQDCSLSDWITLTTCSSCLPPNEYIRVRQIIKQATNGGNPCSNFVTYEAVPCQGPQCVEPTVNLCLCGQFPQTCSADACQYMSESAVLPFTASWNLQYVYNYMYSLSLFTPPRNAFSGLTTMTGNLQMPYNLGMQLNAQCTTTDGNAPTCMPILSLPSFTRVEGSYELQFNGVTGQATGWREGHLLSACIPDSGLIDCLQSRLASYPSNTQGFQQGGYVWDFGLQTWTCPNVCPYMPECCSWSDSCKCSDPIQSGSQSVFASQLETLTCPQFFECQISQPCPDGIPVCPTSLTCPIGCDGTPCNSLSGYGSCTLFNDAFYSCSCNGSIPNAGPDCGFPCPVGPNGQMCSGLGECVPFDTGFVCSCSSLTLGGLACEQAGSAYGAVLESLMYTSTMLVPFQFTSPTSFGSSTLQLYNLLPCEDPNNPYCEPMLATCTTATTGACTPQIPYFQAVVDEAISNPQTLSNYINICVNGDLASVDNANSDFVPAQSMQYQYPVPYGSHSIQCSDIPEENAGLYRFVLLAQFTSHSSIPPYLQNKQFYTRCVDPNWQTTNENWGSNPTIKTQAPCQYFGCATGAQATPDKLLFNLVFTEKTLEEVCAEA